MSKIRMWWWRDRSYCVKYVILLSGVKTPSFGRNRHLFVLISASNQWSLRVSAQRMHWNLAWMHEWQSICKRYTKLSSFIARKHCKKTWSIYMPASMLCFYCLNKSGVNKEFTYHKFPCQTEQCKIYHLWVSAINLKIWVPAANYKVCSSHFKECDFKRNFAAELIGIKRKLAQKGEQVFSLIYGLMTKKIIESDSVVDRVELTIW